MVFHLPRKIYGVQRLLECTNGQRRWLTPELAHWAWPQLQIISAVFATPTQYVLQETLSFFAAQLQLGWAHFL